MRITNNMMINKTISNINGNKTNVDRLNTQMSSQKKIQRPSDDPVIAIRALRLRSTLSRIDQFYEKNIPDAKTWLDVADTALYNMNKILSSVRTECDKGANDYLNANDRKTILENLNKLKEQLYSEGNADNAGRTIFTGYRTGSQLTFMKEETDTTYNITQSFKADRDITSQRYQNGGIDVPLTPGDIANTGNIDIDHISKSEYDRVRLGYDDVKSLEEFSYSYGNTKAFFHKADAVADANGNLVYKAVDDLGNPVLDSTGAQITMTEYADEAAWAAADANGEKKVGSESFAFIRDKGDMVMGETISNTLKSNHADINVNYDKKGFTTGELRPEFYYNCTDKTDPANPVNYVKFDAAGNEIYQDINITISDNQTLTVNLQASNIFDMSIYQDVVELADAVEAAISAEEKVAKIKSMMGEPQYANQQEDLKKWLEGANKEADLANDHMSKLFGAGIGKFDKHMQKVNKSYTEIGTRGDQLEMTESRVSNQQLVTEDLKSKNEDRDLSEIIIDYTASYTAYQAALQAAGKLEKQTLLNYI